MISNINAYPRGRKTAKRGRKPIFNAAIFKERFHTIERVFGWEDTDEAGLAFQFEDPMGRG